MNYTENLSLGLPEYGESADVAALNRNSGILDAYVYNTRQMECEPYDSTKTYMSGDLAIHNEVVYECNTDNTTGTWDDSKWDSTTLAEQIAKAKQMGGESALADLEDVEITNPSTGQALLFDDDDDVWKNQNLPDVSVTKEASGNPIELTDAATAPMVKCVTQITGSQDLHGYDKPWVGGAGKNKIDATTVWSASVASDGSIDYPSGNTKYYIPQTLVGQTLTFSAYVKAYANNSNCRVAVSIDGTITNGNLVNTTTEHTLTQVTFTPQSTNDYVVLANSGSNGNYKDIQLESGSTATTFAPYSNICPIMAYTEGEIEVRGKNIIDWKVNTTSNKWEGTLRPGTYTISAESTLSNGNWYFRFSRGTEEYPYSVSECGFSSFAKAQSGWFYGGEIYQKVTFIVPSDCTLLEIGKLNANGTISAQLEKGSTPTPYEPYTSTTHTTTYPSAIYRGSEDVVNGEVTVTHKKYTPTSWTRNSDHEFYTYFASSEINTGTRRPCISDKFRAWDGTESTSTYGICFINTDGALRINTVDAYSSTSDMMTAIGDISFVCDLATPTTSSVTPTNLPIRTLSGYNHIESSTGEMEVEYITEEYQPLVDLIQSSKHIYSTSEQVVGKWIDGKDLYERTFELDNPSQSGVISTGQTYDIAFLVSGYYVLNDGNSILSANQFLATSNFTYVHVEKDGDIQYRVNGYTATKLSVTIRYTKTTTTRSLSAPLTSQKAQIEPLTDKTDEVPTEEEKAVNEEENTNENR